MAVEMKQGLREQLIFDAVEYKLSEPLDSKRTLCLLGEKNAFHKKGQNYNPKQTNICQL